VIEREADHQEPEQPSTDGPGWGRPLGKPTVTLLLRHGHTELSGERRFSGRTDIPLTKEGVRQATLAARRLAGSGAAAIVTSPLQRARRTAEAVAEATGAPLVTYDEFVEADFGAWQGLTFAEAAHKWPDELAAWMANPDAAPPDGESFATVALRVLAGLDKLIAAYRHQTTIVVSHVTPIKTLVCRALLAPPEAMFRMNLDVASLCHIDCFDNGSAVLRSLNDTAHLQGRRRGMRPSARMS
jgi:ribonuclease H / adenosylcobalamin/alpha-ribazole phosphatase